MARVPVNTPVMLTLGANQTVNKRRAEPYRLDSGIGLMPWDSSAMSPEWVGIRPPNVLAVRLRTVWSWLSRASAMAVPSVAAGAAG